MITPGYTRQQKRYEKRKGIKQGEAWYERQHKAIKALVYQMSFHNIWPEGKTAKPGRMALIEVIIEQQD